MPASYVHEWVAERAMEAFAREPSTFSFHRPALLAGAQGPDPFFYYRVLHQKRSRPINAWATRLHIRRTDDLLLALCGQCDHGDALVRSYALGFLSHYATDSTTHPYVYARSFDDGGRYRTNLHGDLEAAMDTYFYRQSGGRHTPRQMTGFAGLADGECVRIAQPLHNAIRAVFDDSPDQEVILQSFRDSVHYSNMLYSPRGIKRATLGLLGRAVGLPGMIEAHTPPARLPQEDYLHLSGAGWASPWEPERLRRESVPELLEISIQKSLSYWRLALAVWQGEANAGELRAALGGLGYDSGIPWEQAFHLSDGETVEEAKANSRTP